MKIEFFGNGGDVHSLNKINPSSFIITHRTFNILFDPGINCSSSLITENKNIRKIDVVCITGEELEESGDLNTISYLKSYDGFDPHGFLILKRSIKKNPKILNASVFGNYERVISLEDGDNVEIDNLYLKAVKSEVNEDKLNYIISSKKNNILLVDSKESLYSIVERYKSRKFDTLIIKTNGFKIDEIKESLEHVCPKMAIFTMIPKEYHEEGLKDIIRKINIKTKCNTTISEKGLSIDLNAGLI